jgi:hypothetical protein
VSHHTETWTGEDTYGRSVIGWQCLTCGAEAAGYESVTDAEAAGDEHAADGDS